MQTETRPKRRTWLTAGLPPTPPPRSPPNYRRDEMPPQTPSKHRRQTEHTNTENRHTLRVRIAPRGPRIISKNCFLLYTIYLRNNNLSSSQQLTASVCLCVRSSSPGCPGLHPEGPLHPSAWMRPGAHWPEGPGPGWAGLRAGHPGWGSRGVGRWQLPGHCSLDSLQYQYCRRRKIWDIKWLQFDIPKVWTGWRRQPERVRRECWGSWPAVLDRKVFPVDSMAAFHKGTGGFVIDGGQRADVADELIQQGGLDQVRLLRDQRLLWQHHLLGSHGVGGQQTPVNVSPVPQVWVIRVLQRSKCEDYLMIKQETFPNRSSFAIHLSGQTEDLLHQLLRLWRLLEEQLDDGSQQSELNLNIRADATITILSL